MPIIAFVLFLYILSRIKNLLDSIPIKDEQKNQYFIYFSIAVILFVINIIADQFNLLPAISLVLEIIFLFTIFYLIFSPTQHISKIYDVCVNNIYWWIFGYMMLNAFMMFSNMYLKLRGEIHYYSFSEIIILMIGLLIPIYFKLQEKKAFGEEFKNIIEEIPIIDISEKI